MKTPLPADTMEVLEAVHYRPSVSIIMPFEPKMNAHTEITQQLKFVTDEVERQLKANYSEEQVVPILQKLKHVSDNLSFSSFKKSIAIYVSPVFEKVLYLDIPVNEKIIIDGSFEIRDLLQAKKELHEYMVLIISGKSSKVYIGNYNSFMKVKSNVPDNIAAFKHDLPERVANFSDPSDQKQILIDKFLYHTDAGLKFLLQVYPLPVFVMGTRKLIGHFKAITRNNRNIMGYVFGNYDDASEHEIERALEPHLADWKKLKMDYLLQTLEKSADLGRLATGIKDVWRSACQQRGRVLIVEKDFMFAAEQTSDEEVIYKAEESSKLSVIKDAVDDVIEKVLEHGGDVEFVETGMLKDFGHIALILYY